MERIDLSDRRFDVLLERLDRIGDELGRMNKRLDHDEHFLRLTRELASLNESLQALAYAALGTQGPQVRRKRAGCPGVCRTRRVPERDTAPPGESTCPAPTGPAGHHRRYVCLPVASQTGVHATGAPAARHRKGPTGTCVTSVTGTSSREGERHVPSVLTA